MLDINNTKDKIENDNINTNIFDLKKYLKNILYFIDEMINNKIILDNVIKLSIMP